MTCMMYNIEVPTLIKIIIIKKTKLIRKMYMTWNLADDHLHIISAIINISNAAEM